MNERKNDLYNENNLYNECKQLYISYGKREQEQNASAAIMIGPRCILPQG